MKSLESLEELVNRTAKIIGLTIIFAVLGWLILPEKKFFLGLIIGMAVSLANAYLLVKRLNRLGSMDPLTSIVYMRQGFTIRFLLIVITLYLAFKSNQVNFYAVAVGLFSSQLLVYFDQLYRALRELRN